MDKSQSLARFKVATVRHPRDGEPKVSTFSINQLVKMVQQAPVSPTLFDAYHYQRSEQKRLTLEGRTARERGDIERAKDLMEQAKLYAVAVEKTKFGRAVIPFLFKDDITFKTNPKGWRQRDNSGITHFSLLMLDVESNTTKAELHEVLHDFEYILWPTITHRPDDPRYRIVLFPDRPLTLADGQALIYRIDARLPARNDPSKKLQNLDPSCTDIGRLMFLPKWLINHPESYSIVHNVGNVVAPTSFSVTPAIQQSIDVRIAAAEEQRSKATLQTIATIKSAPQNNDSLLISIKGKDRLNPSIYFETEQGLLRLSEITKKVGGVRCPFHADARGSEFIAPNIHTGLPQLVCAKCGVFLMAPLLSDYTDDDEDVETDNAAFAALATKSRANRPPILQPQMHAEKPSTVEERADVLFFSEPRLPDISDAAPERGLFFIRSPKGTGKTHALGTIVEKARESGESVILLTHRRALARNLANRLNIANYQELEDGKLPKLLVICVNSITSHIAETAANYDIVIVDESEQVLRNLLADTLSPNLSDIFNKILLLMQNARQVICLDADLSSDLTIEVIALMRGAGGKQEGDDYVGVINNYPIGSNKVVRSLPSQYQLLSEISQAADAGKKFFVASSTARAAIVIGEVLKKQGTKVLVVAAPTAEHPEVIDFQKDPNDSVTQYDVIVASPSLQTGFSIDVEDHFDHIYGWFENVDGITFQDYDQALSRVRHCDNVTVWVESTRRPPRIDPPAFFIQDAIRLEMKSRQKFLPKERRKLTEGQRLWARIEGLIRYLTAVWSYKRDVQFKAMKVGLGFTIDEIKENDAETESGKLLWNAFKDSGADYALAVFSARILDPDEYLEIVRKNHKTGEEHLAVRRYRFADAIGRELTLELVAQAIDSDLLATFAKARSLVLDSLEARTRYDIEDRKRQHTAFTRVGHRSLEHEILVEHLCKLTDVDIEDYYDRLSAGEEIEVSLPLMDKVLDAYEQRQHDFRHFFDLRIQSIERAVKTARTIAEIEGVKWTPEMETEVIEDARRDRRKRVWNGTFKKVGLPLSKGKTGPRGQQVPYYYIDPESSEVKLFLEAIAKEQAVRAGVVKAFAGIKAPKAKAE
jgi:hypothetical protein